MVHTVKVKREDIPKELQMLLENGKDSNGEEVFSHMPEDLIYLAALVDMQSSMLHLLMEIPCRRRHGNLLPPFRKWQMRHWKNGKSMHSHICKEMRNHAGA